MSAGICATVKPSSALSGEMLRDWVAGGRVHALAGMLIKHILAWDCKAPYQGPLLHLDPAHYRGPLAPLRVDHQDLSARFEL